MITDRKAVEAYNTLIEYCKAKYNDGYCYNIDGFCELEGCCGCLLYAKTPHEWKPLEVPNEI